jgi:hypothetical protein
MNECLDRLNNEKMEFYKFAYRNSKRWTPDQGSLNGKTVIVYGEQGFGDIIQFSRYIPILQSKGCKILFACPKELHRLFACLNVELIDKETLELPPHDFHILSFSLPFALQQLHDGIKFPYLVVPEKHEIDKIDNVKNIGICWESGADNQKNCPLNYFRMLACPYIRFYSLQKQILIPQLLNDCDDFELFGTELEDFYDTAKLINAMDMVISVDTAVLHLAGALNKLTYGILNFEHDPRWDVGNWYHSAVIIRLKQRDNWYAAFKTIIDMCIGIRSAINPDDDLMNLMSS